MVKLDLNENFVCAIWEEKKYYSNLKTTSGLDVEILDFGIKNSDAGPDYKDAKIKIGGINYSGSVEIHKSSGEWNSHKHNNDNKYNDVILQVVFYNDIFNGNSDDPIVKKSRNIPTLALSEFLTESIHTIWKEIIDNPTAHFKLPCFPKNKDVPNEVKISVINKLSLERLRHKTERINFRINDSQESITKKIIWEQTLFEFICESLGYSKNKEQFFKLAKQIELNKIKELNLNKIQIDSALFGLSGFIKDLRFKDIYIGELKSCWNILKEKLKKEIMEKSEWNFFRLRPVNFPTIRIAYASALLFEILHNDFFRKVINVFESSDNVTKDIQHLFKKVTISEYWKKHYNFGKETGSEITGIGNERIKDIMSNVILPFVYLYSQKFENESLRNRIEFYFKKEKQTNRGNEVTRVMQEQLGIKIDSLADEQGLIQLHNFYCVNSRCKVCDIGKIVFENDNVNEPFKIILY